MNLESTKNLPPASIVIPSWNAAQLLEKCLPSVLNQNGIHYEVWVVDDGSENEDTALLIQKLQKTYHHLKFKKLQKNTGYTGAVNAGVEAAQYSLVMVLCNDNIIERDCLYKLVSFYESLSKQLRLGAIMARTEIPGVVSSYRGTLNFCGRNIQYHDQKWVKEVLPIFHPGGNAFIFDKKLWGKPFEDFYFAYHEDVSLGWRMRNQGYEVLHAYCSRVQTFDGGSTRRRPYFTAFLSERNRWINFFTFPEVKTILKLVPLWTIDILFILLFGKNKRAKFHAWCWMIYRAHVWIELRRERQSIRSVSDDVALKEMSPLYFSEIKSDFISLFQKGINQILMIYFKLLKLPFVHPLKNEIKNVGILPN